MLCPFADDLSDARQAAEQAELKKLADALLAVPRGPMPERPRVQMFCGCSCHRLIGSPPGPCDRDSCDHCRRFA